LGRPGWSIEKKSDAGYKISDQQHISKEIPESIICIIKTQLLIVFAAIGRYNS